MHSFTARTPRHDLKVECLTAFVRSDEVGCDKAGFLELCKKGCRNYGSKYSCPPFSPDYNALVKDHEYLFVVLFKIDLNQLTAYKDYHRLRVGNAVIKPRIERLMRVLEGQTGTKYLSTGACRLCKPCRKRLGEPCRHPKEMRYSLESVGVDCNMLVKGLFGFPLLWYKDKKAPEYTAVVCALPIKEKDENLIRLAHSSLS